MVLQAHEEWEQARQWYQRTLELGEGQFRWLYNLAYVEVQLGQYEQALGSIEKARQFDPEDPPARLLHAKLLYDAGKIEESEAEYKGLTNLGAGPAAYGWYGVGRCRAALGDSDGAVGAFRQAIDLYPHYGQALFDLSQQLRRGSSVDEASRTLELAEEHKALAPPFDDPHLEGVQALAVSAVHYVEEARKRTESGELNGAARLLERAARADPQSPQALINLIAVYGQLGQGEQAEEAYLQAVAINPNEAEAYFNFGILAAQQERFEEAEEAFRKAVEINPQDADAQFGLRPIAATNRETGRRRQALHPDRGRTPGVPRGPISGGNSALRIGPLSRSQRASRKDARARGRRNPPLSLRAGDGSRGGRRPIRGSELAATRPRTCCPVRAARTRRKNRRRPQSPRGLQMIALSRDREGVVSPSRVIHRHRFTPRLSKHFPFDPPPSTQALRRDLHRARNPRLHRLPATRGHPLSAGNIHRNRPPSRPRFPPLHRRNR